MNADWLHTADGVMWYKDLLLLNLRPMRETASLVRICRMVEQRLIDDKWFTIDFDDILNSFWQERHSTYKDFQYPRSFW